MLLILSLSNLPHSVPYTKAGHERHEMLRRVLVGGVVTDHTSKEIENIQVRGDRDQSVDQGYHYDRLRIRCRLLPGECGDEHETTSKGNLSITIEIQAGLRLKVSSQTD